MNGLEIAEAFFNASRAELFAGELAFLEERMAAGLVGEGSECFGFDDEASRDHDWGPAFCIWLPKDDFDAAGAELERRYQAIAARGFEGFPPRKPAAPGVQRRVGVFTVGEFYYRLLGWRDLPQTRDDWRALPEAGLAAATNGKVFADNDGQFTQVRNVLLGYYFDDVRLRKIARGCMMAAQAGQYNFARQAKRGEDVAAFTCLARFVDAVHEIVYATCKRYLIFYKWAHRGLLDLGAFGTDVHGQLDQVVESYRAGNVARTQKLIEIVCETVMDELHRQGLSSSFDPFLVKQAVQVNARINDNAYRATDLMQV